MIHTIPKKAIVALPDFQNPKSEKFTLVTPEQALIPAFDRSFHFGDSIYEVVRSYQGILFSLEDHLRRLKQSAELARFEQLPHTDLILRMTRQACQQFFRIYGNQEVYVRITISRGFGDLMIDPAYASDPYTLVFVKALDVYDEKYYTQGMHYAIVNRRRNLPSALDPAMKSGNYLNNILAIAEAKKIGAQDALMLNYQGFVTEGTTNNVYVVKEGEVWTAPLSIGILAGITRDLIFKICKKEGISIQERLFTAQDVFNSQEMFLSSSIKEVMPITKLSGKPIGNGKLGPVTNRLSKAFKNQVQEYIKTHSSESLFL